MESVIGYVVLAVLVLVGLVVAGVALVRGRGRTQAPPRRPGIDYAPGVGDDAEVPRHPTRGRRCRLPG
jgi:fused signal recognition particle receptor